MHRQVCVGEGRVWRKTDMEVAVPVLLKMVFCLFLLRALAARPHSSGRRRMLGVFFCVERISDDVILVCTSSELILLFAGQYQQMGRRGETGLELAPRWWSEDYSLPRSRRHVNNNLEHWELFLFCLSSFCKHNVCCWLLCHFFIYFKIGNLIETSKCPSLSRSLMV